MAAVQDTPASPLPLPGAAPPPGDGLVPGLDTLAEWRLGLQHGLDRLEHLLRQTDLLTAEAGRQCELLRQRLSGDRLVLAFVAEFSRGKSELINAIFFADAGRRLLPATPGRTTMCPVELSWDEAEPPALRLLPIASRLKVDSLEEWRQRRERWHTVPLDPADPAGLAQSLGEVTRVRRVPRDEARALGLWSQEQPQDNPPMGADGLVEVPAWRHAIINLPHPLLRNGLVVLDTPGLNAIGTEPELTLGLLPTANAVLFVLGADTGVTRSDLAVWNQHLGDPSLSRFVVLNKVDAMLDPLLDDAGREQAIAAQCAEVAAVLGVPRDRVFPVSARQALVARLGGDADALAASRLPLLEAALQQQLLPQRQRLLGAAVVSHLQSMEGQIARRVRDLRRGHAEQMLELRSLRGKSQGRVGMMLARVGHDTEEFNRCLSRLTAVRSVQQRLMAAALSRLDGSHVREAGQRLQRALAGGWFHLRAGSVFAQVCDTLDQQLSLSARGAAEAERMLEASFRQLNVEFGFTLEVALPPDLAPMREELRHIQRGYSRYFGLSGMTRMNAPGFSEQFQRMLVSKLRTVFEQAAGAVDAWGDLMLQQLDHQFKERRRAFHRRRDTLERIRQASGELEQRLAEVEQQDQRLLVRMEEAYRLITAVRETAQWAVSAPAGAPASEPGRLAVGS